MCGNGVTRSSEECDDGNDKNGDGCSEKCQIEEGFICVPTEGGRSDCQKPEEFNQAVMNNVKTQMLGCNSRTSPMAFVMDSLINGSGHCVSMPTPGELKDVDIGVLNSTLHGIHPSEPAAVSILSTIVTPPTSVDSIQDGRALTGAEPYALCQTNLVKFCTTEAISDHSLQRSCFVHGNSMCREVILEERFCDSEQSKAYGAVKAERRHNDPRGETVCVFPGCRTPSSWMSSEGATIDPEAWCLFPTLNSVP